MKQLFDEAKFAAGLLATGALLAAGACSHADGRHAPETAPPASQTAIAPASRHAGMAARDCGPPYLPTAPRTMHPAVVATGQAGVSPPLSSLPPAKSPPPGSRHVVPLHRLVPWSERCPPPTTAPAARS